MSKALNNAIKLNDIVSVTDFGAVGDGVTDDTAAIQAAIDYACPSQTTTYAADEIKALWFPAGVYKVSNILLQQKCANDTDNRFFCIYGNGVRIEQISGSTGPVLEISSCKKLHISDLQIYGETYITGMWDSILENINFNSSYGGDGNYGIKFGTRYAAGTGLFDSNYWNKFTRCRIGASEFKIYDASNQEFNANTFDSSIISGIEIIGNANGSFQGNVWIGGELRGDPFISVDAASGSTTPNSLTIVSAYFDQASIQSNLYDFQIKTLGVCPATNGYVLDGQPIEYAGSSLETSLGGVREGARIPVSSTNFIPNGDLKNAAVGEAGGIAGIARTSCTSLVSSSGGAGAFSAYYTPTSTTASGNVSFDTDALPFDGTYTLTVIYRKPASNRMQVRTRKNGATSASNTFANEQTNYENWISASYTTTASAGDTLGVNFYATAIGQSVDIAYVGCTYGATGILLSSDAPTTSAQPKVVWRAAQPTAGTWALGDIVYNTAPAAGGTVGWICTTAGTPGTWKTFGAIAA